MPTKKAHLLTKKKIIYQIEKNNLNKLLILLILYEIINWALKILIHIYFDFSKQQKGYCFNSFLDCR
jgi:hypothetical protein